MSDKTQTILCRFHDVTFQATGNGLTGIILRCPVCNDRDLQRLRAELTTVTKQRDTLLAAVELKRLLTPITVDLLSHEEEKADKTPVQG